MTGRDATLTVFGRPVEGILDGTFVEPDPAWRPLATSGTGAITLTQLVGPSKRDLRARRKRRRWSEARLFAIMPDGGRCEITGFGEVVARNAEAMRVAVPIDGCRYGPVCRVIAVVPPTRREVVRRAARKRRARRGRR